MNFISQGWRTVNPLLAPGATVGAIATLLFLYFSGQIAKVEAAYFLPLAALVPSWPVVAYYAGLGRVTRILKVIESWRDSGLVPSARCDELVDQVTEWAIIRNCPVG